MPRGASSPGPSDRRFLIILGAILLGGLLSRVAYLLAQPAVDIFYSRAIHDGEYYLGWARAIAHGASGPTGAFYLAPLYPHLLATLMKLGGESFTLIYLLQHLLSLATAAMIAILGRHLIGRYAALAAAGLFLLYHPILFFASRPLGETVSIFLLFAALLFGAKGNSLSAAGAGFVAGLAALSRPNLLLIPLLWAAGEGSGRRWKRTLLIAGCALLAILPVTLRNLAVSGHAVLISSNGGLTAYHGNGPDAQGVYTPPEGFASDVRASSQRDAATALARRLSGLELDDVEADGWWGRKALEARLEDPVSSLVLLSRRLLLTIDNHEHGLDYHPMLDRNPWRRVAFVPLALLLGLAATGVLIRGYRRTGGWWIWGAIIACAATPLLFYVSSRYRLPFAALLVLPAGCGLAALIRGERKSRILALVLGAALLAASYLIPFYDVKNNVDAEALAYRARAWMQAGRLDIALDEANRALELSPESATVNFFGGVVTNAAGFAERAESLYRKALLLDPAYAPAAGNLAQIVMTRGEFAEAIAILEAALLHDPGEGLAWNNLVLAYAGAGDIDHAKDAARRAETSGITLDPAMLQAFGIE